MVSLNFLKLVLVGVLMGHLFETVVGQVSYGVAKFVTPAFFDGLKDHMSGDCVGKNFFSREAFLEAARMYPGFGAARNRKHEIAAFFANVQHETGRFCFIEEKDKSNYCENSNTYPCNGNKQYYGRGPLQLSWNYNYINAGRSIGFDGLNNPEIVANDPVISFKTALWFWMNNVHDVSIQGFGPTIRKINGMECNGGNRGAVQSRVNFYRNICNQFGIAVLDNLYC